jgi:hypothetical protein
MKLIKFLDKRSIVSTALLKDFSSPLPSCRQMEYEIMLLCNFLGVSLVMMFVVLNIVGFTEESNGKVLQFEKEE